MRSLFLLPITVCGGKVERRLLQSMLHEESKKNLSDDDGESGEDWKKAKSVEATAPQRCRCLSALADEHLDISTLETWLWDAACAIRT